jgi:hypothetical protein
VNIGAPVGAVMGTIGGLIVGEKGAALGGAPMGSAVEFPKGEGVD